MKCNNCGYTHDGVINYCPKCGCQMFFEAISLNPMADRVSGVFTSGMFLTICILLSISSVATLLSGDGIPVFPILFSIFLWLCFAQGKKGFVDQTHVRSISGTLFAYYILEYVAVGIVVILGILSVALPSYVFQSIESSAQFSSSTITSSTLSPEIYNLLGIILAIASIGAAAIVVLINIFGFRKIHKFVQSIYKSIEYNQNQIVFAKTARTWLIVFGSIALASALISLLSSAAALLPAFITLKSAAELFAIVVSNVCLGLSGIFAGVLIHKHFIAN